MRRLLRRGKEPRSDVVAVSQPSTGFPAGIRELHVPNQGIVDIVFIHGLTGDRERTWTATDAAAPWPSLLLPAEIPQARILTFGYDAYVTSWHGLVSENKIGNHAMNLLTSLVAHRDRDGTTDRPIIFVCHSLGGLVCEDALNMSHQNAEPHLRKVMLSTRGILFMGTPHRGAGLAEWATMLAKSLGLVKQTNMEILQTLRRSSEVLERIQDDFHNGMRMRDERSPVDITCFYEELPLPGVGLIVSRESAIIPGRIPISIHANHMNMTKFKTADDPGFVAVVGELRRWVQKMNLEEAPKSVASSPGSLTASERNYVAGFGHPYLVNLDERVEGTCCWSTQSPQYLSWRKAHQSAILWLTGNAGCGKTMVTNFLFQQLKQQNRLSHEDHSASLTCSFFCNRDIEFQHDVQSLVKGLIRQILLSIGKIVRQLKKTIASMNYQSHSSFETLWPVFEELIQFVPRQNIYVVIDALDECDGSSKFLSKVMNSIRAMNKSDLAPNKKVKFIISGQPRIKRIGSAVANVGQYFLDFEELPQGVIDDVARFVDDGVSKLIINSICSQRTGDRLGLLLKSRSENSFLWLRVVLEYIGNGLRYREADILQMLEHVPANLQDLFGKYLPTIEFSDISFLQRYLKLIVASARPMTLAEVDAFTNSDVAYMERLEDDVIKRSIKDALGPLVKFPNNTVQLVHSTVKQFFIMLQSQTQHRLHNSHGVDQAAAHSYCAVSCMNYITNERALEVFSWFRSDQDSQSTNPDFPQSPTEADDRLTANLFDLESVHFLKDDVALQNEMVSMIQDRLVAYDYAACHWAYHLAQSEHLADETVLGKAIQLLTCLSDPLGNWYRYAAHVSHFDMPSSEDLDPAVIAALFNLANTLRLLLIRGTYSADSQHLHKALCWAAARGHGGPAIVLLEYGTPAHHDGSNLVPVSMAIRGGHTQTCSLFLRQAKTDPNRPDHEGKPPLVLAASSNHYEILRQLLQMKSIQVDLADTAGRTALAVACANGSKDCVDALLVDSRSDPNIKDHSGKSSLHHASLSGNPHIVKKLLLVPELERNASNADGRNALSLAAQKGHISVVRHLCQHGVSAAHTDIQGRNAISWACNSLDSVSCRDGESVLQYLVEKFPRAADAPDENGWTPLAWTMDSPGYLESMQTLLRAGCVNVNQRDNTYGRSVLGWAASQGLGKMVQVLLTVEGIEKNSLNFDGRSPISHAAANGNEEVVEILLKDKQTKTNLVDASGRTPLDWARLNGHPQIITLLTAESQDELSSRELM